MKKIEIIELIQRNLAGGDVPADIQGDYDEEIITLYIAMAYNKIFFELVRASYNIADSTPLDKFTKAFIIEQDDIKKDTIRKKFYIELPIPSANVPWNEAIRYCGPADEESAGYIWRSPAASPVMGGLEIETVEQGIRYMIENQRVYFYLMDSEPEAIMIKMLMSWEAWDDLDDIGIPAGTDSQLFNIVVSQIQGADNRDDVVTNQNQDEPRAIR